MPNPIVNIPEELSKRSRRFWYGLSMLFDEEKKKPAFMSDPIRIPFDNNYILESDSTSTYVYNVNNPSKKCQVKKNQKDDFPFCKLLDWYLKDAVLNEVKRRKTSIPERTLR